ncbi:DUF1491 family protein [Pseudohoeflea coraliihabitans]|uniref:DUF1491 family protein n=1 Tax=Pseudohoeflea coraliihabitans TaxID=2860393 RepID=A0ABS6WRP7_9HYPH|nr:DUF1491 family protein [Pseudohoeflea sp. DP4N28-3]MBW3098646.1 DUF1491 family protein [Pseudohoeflea sp. DP4N28-3]
MARLKSGLFVAALIRRLFAEGGLAAVEQRGSEEAGAIHFRIRHRNGRESRLAPAPQSIFETGRPEDRRFEWRQRDQPEWEISEALRRERDFDPDIWIVELETDRPEEYLDIVPDESAR